MGMYFNFSLSFDAFVEAIEILSGVRPAEQDVQRWLELRYLYRTVGRDERKRFDGDEIAMRLRRWLYAEGAIGALMEWGGFYRNEFSGEAHFSLNTGKWNGTDYQWEVWVAPYHDCDGGYSNDPEVVKNILLAQVDYPDLETRERLVSLASRITNVTWG